METLSSKAQKLLDDFTRDFPLAGRRMATIDSFRRLLNVSVEENPNITYEGYTEEGRPDQGSTPVTVKNQVYMPKDVRWTGPSLEAQQKAISHFAFEVQNARKAKTYSQTWESTIAAVKAAVNANAPVDGPLISNLGEAYAKKVVTQETLNSFRVGQAWAEALAEGNMKLANPSPRATTGYFLASYRDQQQNGGDALQRRVNANLNDKFDSGTSQGRTRLESYQLQIEKRARQLYRDKGIESPIINPRSLSETQPAIDSTAIDVDLNPVTANDIQPQSPPILSPEQELDAAMAQFGRTIAHTSAMTQQFLREHQSLPALPTGLIPDLPEVFDIAAILDPESSESSEIDQAYRAMRQQQFQDFMQARAGRQQAHQGQDSIGLDIG